jgi:predicted esterase
LVARWLNAPADPALYRHTQPVEYYLYVPSRYSADREWPLFIGIHGSGGSGLDCWRMWQIPAESEGYILLCPSMPNNSYGGWSQEEGERVLFGALREVKKEYRIQARYYLAGFSAGGAFVQGVVFRYPGLVSGVAVLSAGRYYPPNGYGLDVPFLVMIGDQDDSLRVTGAGQFAATLRQMGYNVSYHELTGVGHWVTTDTIDLTLQHYRKVYGK